LSTSDDELQRRDKRAREYFRDELNYLRGMGHLFGLANPSIAGLLIERGSDPDVERLLEGFAFLTARIHQRVDDAVPEVVHGLAELLVPHYLRPLPACSVVEFTPQVRALRARSRVPAGVELGTDPVDGGACTFRTTADVDLLPLTLTDAALDRASVTAPVLRLFFQTTELGRSEVFKPEGLRLFINAELSAGALILLWLARYCRGVEVRGASTTVSLGADAVRPIGFEPSFPLLPWPRATDGYRVVQEYFTLPQKFLFFEVRGLEAAARITDERFEIAFQLDRPPPLDVRITREMFRLHCAPVVNLFRTPADPIFRHALDREHMLRAADQAPEHMEVYSVDEVVGVRAGRSERRVYRPFHDFSHVNRASEPGAFYRLRRVPSPINDGTDTFLAVDSPRNVLPELELEETLSIELTCTNRSLPARLQVGDICKPTASSPTNARFRNLVGVTRPARAPLGSDLQWRLLSHLSINARSLADASTLRRLMELYNFQAMADVLAGRANQNRIDSIQAVSARPLTRFLEGTPVRGHQVTVDVDESAFVGPGDAFLFGSVLDELFAANVTLNSFTELVLRLQPSQTEFRWSPRNGSQLIL
jgi:type VI secretion system protein ImpG